MDLIPAHRNALIRRELLNEIRQHPLLLVKIVMIFGILGIAELEAENVCIGRPDALLLLLTHPPLRLRVPALGHHKSLVRPATGRLDDSRRHEVRVARHGDPVLLLVVIVMVVKLVVVAPCGVLAAYAVAFCDVEHVAPVIGCSGRRRPDWGAQDRWIQLGALTGLHGKYRDDERDQGEDDGVHFLEIGLVVVVVSG